MTTTADFNQTMNPVLTTAQAALDQTLALVQEGLDATSGGLITATALFDLDGKIVSGPEVRTAWGRIHWRLDDVAAHRYTTRYVEPSTALSARTRARSMRGKGFTVGLIRIPGRVTVEAREDRLGDLRHRIVIIPDERAFAAGQYEAISVDGGDVD